jgi:hypothetical protein
VTAPAGGSAAACWLFKFKLESVRRVHWQPPAVHRAQGQGADTPVPVPVPVPVTVPVPDLPGDGDGTSVTDLPGGGDAPPSPSRICPESGTLPRPPSPI